MMGDEISDEAGSIEGESVLAHATFADILTAARELADQSSGTGSEVVVTTFAEIANVVTALMVRIDEELGLESPDQMPEGVHEHVQRCVHHMLSVGWLLGMSASTEQWAGAVEQVMAQRQADGDDGLNLGLTPEEMRALVARAPRGDEEPDAPETVQ